MSGVINALIESYGTASPTYSGTITSAYLTNSSSYFEYIYLAGSSGSASPNNVLSDGNTIYQISTYYNGYPVPTTWYSTFSVTIGYNPGSTYIPSITVGGTTFPLTSAGGFPNYSYSGGRATWSTNTNNTAPVIAPSTSGSTVTIP
jgi:hypothetical protein